MVKKVTATNVAGGKQAHIGIKQRNSSKQQQLAAVASSSSSSNSTRHEGATGLSRPRIVLTVRSGVEQVMGWGHISAADHVTSGGASRIPHRPPSRMTQSRPRSAQNTCGVTDWCVSHSIHPSDPRKRKITIK